MAAGKRTAFRFFRFGCISSAIFLTLSCIINIMAKNKWELLDTSELRNARTEKLRALKIQTSYTADKSGLSLFVMKQAEDLQMIQEELSARLNQNARWIADEAARILEMLPRVPADSSFTEDQISKMSSELHEIIWDAEAVLGEDSAEHIFSAMNIKAANGIAMPNSE